MFKKYSILSKTICPYFLLLCFLIHLFSLLKIPKPQQVSDSFLYIESAIFSPVSETFSFVAFSTKLRFSSTCGCSKNCNFVCNCKCNLYCKWRQNGATVVTKGQLTTPNIAGRDCKWITYVGTCIANANAIELSISPSLSKSSFLPLPYVLEEQKPHNVVVCTSPMYSFERWTLLVTFLEVSRHFGADLVVIYYETANWNSFKLLKEYEKSGFVKLQLFPMLPKYGNVNPNLELHYQRQDAAFSHCFQLMKRSAKFIIFTDLDEPYFPPSGSTYFRDFTELRAKYNTASAFRLVARNIFVDLNSTGVEPANFEFSFFNEIDVESCEGSFIAPKSIIIPDRIESVDTHQLVSKLRYKAVELNCSERSFYRVRAHNDLQYKGFERQFRATQKELLSLKDIEKLNRSFRSVVSKTAITSMPELLNHKIDACNKNLRNSILVDGTAKMCWSVYHCFESFSVNETVASKCVSAVAETRRNDRLVVKTAANLIQKDTCATIAPWEIY